jgi:16S rRNA (guanine527-N7)-methyltransferase
MPEGPERSDHPREAVSRKDREILVYGASRLGISLDMDTVQVLERFLGELKRWNRRVNLTGLRDDRTIIVRHFLDSFTLLRYLPEGISLLDIGSGAGLPGIPLKIVRPSLHVVLLEASRKKTYFHKHVIRSLQLTEIESIWGRSDEGETRATLGERFDRVVSRALSPLEAFLREAIHFVRPGGMVIAMRGRNVARSFSLEGLPIQLDRVVPVELPFDQIERNLLVFRRVAEPV